MLMRTIYSTLAGLMCLLIQPPMSLPAQLQQGLSDCGDRPKARYAAVFDASSSLRRHPDLRARTKMQYVGVLSALSGILCASDELAVYAFVADTNRVMSPLHVLTTGSRSPAHLSRLADQILDTHTGHTDLHVALAAIARDELTNSPVAVFVVTDGSYFPLRPDSSDNTIEGLTDRLSAFRAFVSDTLARQTADSVGLVIVGVNADDSPAIDGDLAVRFPASAAPRTWRGIDLRDDKGGDLLRAVFDTRYVPYASLSLWAVLFTSPPKPWERRIEYLSDEALNLAELDDLTIDHFIFTAGGSGEAESCSAALPPGTASRSAETVLGPRGGMLCSIAGPTAEELRRLPTTVKTFAFRQGRSLWPDVSPFGLGGLHELVFRDSTGACAAGTVSSYFGRGDPWPPRDAQKMGAIRLSHPTQVSWGEPINLLLIKNAGCIVPHFTGAGWRRPAGDYLIKIETGDTSVFRAHFDEPRDSVLQAFIRPGGLPFPSDQIALVRVCVRSKPMLTNSERMWMMLGNKRLELTPERGKRCDGPFGNDPAVAAFSGLVWLPRTDRSSTMVFVLRHDTDPQSPLTGAWTPVHLDRDGRLFLSWQQLALCFAAGFLIQVIYACHHRRRFKRVRLRRPALWPAVLLSFQWRRLLKAATWLGALTSGVIVCVFAEFVVLVMETDIATDAVPVIFALSVLAHMVQLIAAALVPEHVEEFLLND